MTGMPCARTRRRRRQRRHGFHVYSGRPGGGPGASVQPSSRRRCPPLKSCAFIGVAPNAARGSSSWRAWKTSRVVVPCPPPLLDPPPHPPSGLPKGCAARAGGGHGHGERCARPRRSAGSWLPPAPPRRDRALIMGADLLVISPGRSTWWLPVHGSRQCGGWAALGALRGGVHRPARRGRAVRGGGDGDLPPGGGGGHHRRGLWAHRGHGCGGGRFRGRRHRRRRARLSVSSPARWKVSWPA